MEETLALRLSLQRLLKATYTSSVKFTKSLGSLDRETLASRIDSLQSYVEKKCQECVAISEQIRRRLERREKAEENEVPLRIVEFLGRRGFYGTAEALVGELGLEDLVDVGLYREVKDMKDSVLRGDIERGIACLESATKATGMSKGGFREAARERLWSRKFIELCKEKRKAEAIQWCRGEEGLSIERRLLPLLVLPFSSELAEELASSHTYSSLSGLLMEYISYVHTGSAASLLSKRLRYGLIGFKSSECRRKGSAKRAEGSPCPSCRESLFPLTKILPKSVHSNTRLICQATGQVISDANPPYALPNGYVYSKRYFDRFTGGTVVCFKTGAVFQKNPRLCYFV